MFDIDALTLGETAQIEEIAGQSISAFSNEETPKGKLLVAAAFVFGKRLDPTFTINQAEALTFGELTAMFDPTEADPKEPKH